MGKDWQRSLKQGFYETSGDFSCNLTVGVSHLVHTPRLLGFHRPPFRGQEHTADAGQKKGEAQVGATSRVVHPSEQQESQLGL